MDKKVHPVTVTAGRTAVVKVKDLPQLDPVGVLLEKLTKRPTRINHRECLSGRGRVYSKVL